ncbi:hypothetical protein [Actinomarinicola tropica]|uniref:Uncharacterized protein n=1 Tax=Actinomarinicola tropica TaxID=2789776 RepID=A0A5Q2RQG7_9ACTN|nr:hypothetical protein [Actinomarinicola tropica]QGG95445.1 hypothetical protein GH723_10235 [Actinomarinicola tropica]
MTGTSSTWVEFPEFRQYEATRQQANNAMMALLAGSKLAAHTLQLTSGSRQLLPEIFPGVEHISYFNLRTDAATQLLLDTGHHLGAVAVPYALAVHEDFVMTVLEMLDTMGRVRRAPGTNSDLTKNRVRAWNMHEAVYLTLGQPVPARGSAEVALEHFHLLREMRNAHIHSGGSISSELQDQVTDISAPAEAEWHRVARRAPADVIAMPRLRFTTFDIFAAFGATKALGRTINTLLRDGLTPTEWAEICRSDYSAVSSKSAGSDQWIRGLLGHGTAFYGTTSMTQTDLLDAAIAAGQWTAGRSFAPRRSQRNARRTRDPGSLHEGGGV